MLNQLSKWTEKEWHQFGRFLGFPCYHLPIWEQRILAVRSVLRGPRKAVFLSVEVGDKKKMMYFTGQQLWRKKYNHEFHRAATLKEKYKYVFDRSVTLKDTHIEANTNYCWCVQRCLLILGWGEREVGESFSCFERIRRTSWPESPLSNKSRGLGGVKSFY